MHRLRTAPATSATNSLIELVPTSMTARRTGSMGRKTYKTPPFGSRTEKCYISPARGPHRAIPPVRAGGREFFFAAASGEKHRRNCRGKQAVEAAQVPIPKPQRQKKPEIRRPDHLTSGWRVSNFGFRISFGLRHSDLGFCQPEIQEPARMGKSLAKTGFAMQSELAWKRIGPKKTFKPSAR
jgi:hypothetical protein